MLFNFHKWLNNLIFGLLLYMVFSNNNRYPRVFTTTELSADDMPWAEIDELDLWRYPIRTRPCFSGYRTVDFWCQVKYRYARARSSKPVVVFRNWVLRFKADAALSLATMFERAPDPTPDPPPTRTTYEPPTPTTEIPINDSTVFDWLEEHVVWHIIAFIYVFSLRLCGRGHGVKVRRRPSVCARDRALTMKGFVGNRMPIANLVRFLSSLPSQRTNGCMQAPPLGPPPLRTTTHRCNGPRRPSPMLS